MKHRLSFKNRFIRNNFSAISSGPRLERFFPEKLILSVKVDSMKSSTWDDRMIKIEANSVKNGYCFLAEDYSYIDSFSKAMEREVNVSLREKAVHNSIRFYVDVMYSLTVVAR